MNKVHFLIEKVHTLDQGLPRWAIIDTQRVMSSKKAKGEGRMQLRINRGKCGHNLKFTLVNLELLLKNKK